MRRQMMKITGAMIKENRINQPNCQKTIQKLTIVAQITVMHELRKWPAMALKELIQKWHIIA